MQYMYEQKKQKKDNFHPLFSTPLFSAKKPETKLETNNKVVNTPLKLKQKQKIKIYIQDDKYYIEHAAAFALKLVETRAIMLDTPKLVLLPPEVHNKIKSNDEFEIEYQRLEKNTKEKLKVYYDGENYAIECGAAYALNLMSVEEFSNADTKYYYIDEEFLRELQTKFDVEITSLHLQENLNEIRQM